MAQAMLKHSTGSNDKILTQQIGTTPYWHGVYAKNNVVLHAASGYINVTRFCKDFKKEVKNWMRLKSSKDLVRDIAAVTSVDGQLINPAHMLILIKGGSGDSIKDICGTYAHPSLFAHVALWASTVFAFNAAVLCNRVAGLQSKLTRAALDSLLSDDVTPKVVDAVVGEAAKEDKPEKSKEPQQFLILKRADAEFPYQVIEGTVKSVIAAVKRF